MSVHINITGISSYDHVNCAQLSSDHWSNALLDGLLEVRETMPIVLPQQFLSFFIGNLGHVFTYVGIFPKVFAWLKLPEHREKMIIALWRSEAKDTFTIARRVNQCSHVQLRIIGDVDEVLRRELRQRSVLAGVCTDDPVCSTVACFSEARAVVGTG